MLKKSDREELERRLEQGRRMARTATVTNESAA
jgi:hypothetical protein